MSRRRSTALDDLSHLPWWLCLLLGAIVYVGVRFGLPRLDLGHPVLAQVGPTLAELAWVPALLFGLAALGSALRGVSRRRLLDRQASLEDIRALSWRRFEQLVGEAYRRRGFAVVESGGGGPDEGIDLVLRRGSERVAVQCKRWRTRRIGVGVVRELLGAMTATGAQRGIVVGSGTFTAPAVAFARDNGIELVDGEALATLVASVRDAGNAASGDGAAVQSAAIDSSRGVSPPRAPAPVDPAHVETPAGAKVSPQPLCPTCGALMVERTARRGANVGQRFLGCSSYPSCRTTQALP